MKRIALAAVVVSVGVSAGAPLGHAGKGGTAVLTPTADLKWNDVPSFPGVKMAVAEGNPAKGASHFFIKFTGGFAAPVHHHTANHFVTVISGSVTLTVDGKETTLPAGSFFQFKGKKLHATGCAAGADCVLFVDSRGKWDVIPQKAPAAAKTP